MSLISKIVSGGQTDVDRGALEAARLNGFPYGGYVPKGRLSEDGTIPAEFACMTEDARKDYLHRTELNVIHSDATLILSRTRELTGGTKRTVEFSEKHGKPYWIDNPENPNETAKGPEFLYWVEAGFAERGIVLNVADPRKSKEPGIQAAACKFVGRILNEPGLEVSPSEVKIIGQSPFVKADDDEGYLWSFKAIDPVTKRQIDTSISPYALLNSLGETHGVQDLLTCGCGVADCAGIRYERFENTEAYVRWSLNFRGTACTLYFDRSVYEIGAIEMLHDIYVAKIGWKFNGSEYYSYEDFKTAVDEFLAAKPHFKAIWDEMEGVSA